MKKIINDKGSITLEATLIVPIFLFAIITLIFLLNVVWTHELVEYSICEAAEEITYENIRNENPVNILFFKQRVLKYLENSEDNKTIYNGYSGIDFSFSQGLEEGLVSLTVRYKVNFPVINNFIPDLHMLQRVVFKDWNYTENCEEEQNNIWSLPPLERGKKIQNMYGRDSNMPHNFPVIASIKGGIATSIKSINLNSKTYDKTQNIENRVAGLIDDLYEFSGGRVGSYSISPSDIIRKKLIIVIPKGTITEEERIITNQLKDMAYDKGITLIIEEL
jgi:hypothetical protein